MLVASMMDELRRSILRQRDERRELSQFSRRKDIMRTRSRARARNPSKSGSHLDDSDEDTDTDDDDTPLHKVGSLGQRTLRSRMAEAYQTTRPREFTSFTREATSDQEQGNY